LTDKKQQETEHALTANGALAKANATQIQPCNYTVPVSSFNDSILLAQTFTDVVLGTLPEAQALFAADGGQESALVPLFGSVIGQEGEQVGWFRTLQIKIPSAAPFLTGGNPAFAFSALSQFIVPGSCPNINVLGMTAFPPLTLVTAPKDQNSTAAFSITRTVFAQAGNSSIVYLSGQNLPVSVPITGVAVKGNTTTFSASFPFDEGFARGLTIAALVKGTSGNFSSAAAVANATIAGPALIEID